MIHFAILALAAFAAGIVNALAGGGTFLTFAALLASGIAPITANATSTMALYPGYFASAYAGRETFREVSSQPELHLVRTSIIAVFGGLLGALLLLWTPAAFFKAIVPWLVGFATLVFMIGTFMRKPEPVQPQRHALGATGISAMQLPMAIYGGYFGAGIGILILAAMAFFGLRDIKQMNVLKLLFVGLSNSAAVAAFIFAGRILWPEALVMMAFGIVGGFVGGHLGNTLKPLYIRVFIIGVGIFLTIRYAFFA